MPTVIEEYDLPPDADYPDYPHLVGMMTAETLDDPDTVRVTFTLDGVAFPPLTVKQLMAVGALAIRIRNAIKEAVNGG